MSDRRPVFLKSVNLDQVLFVTPTGGVGHECPWATPEVDRQTQQVTFSCGYALDSTTDPSAGLMCPDPSTHNEQANSDCPLRKKSILIEGVNGYF